MRIKTLHPRTYADAATIGQLFREGTPVIINLTEMGDSDAKRLIDFAAGLIFGLHGSIDRVTNKVFLLSPESTEPPTEDEVEAVTPSHQLAAARAGINTATAVTRELSTMLTSNPDPPDPYISATDLWGEETPPEVRRPARLRAAANRLQRLALPLDLSAMDLSEITIHIEDLTGAIWTSDTIWPSPGISAQVRDISEELSSGIYQVRSGTERSPTGILVGT